MAELKSLHDVIKSGVEKALNKPILEGRSVLEWAKIGMDLDRVKVVRCSDCRFYSVEDFWGEFGGVPVLGASNCPTCHKWGGEDGRKTSPDGWCFLAEPKEKP